MDRTRAAQDVIRQAHQCEAEGGMTKSHAKLDKLAELEGIEDVDAMLEMAAFDSVAPAICMNEDCDYTTGMEPDQDRGWCECCETNSVKSCLILARMI
jgi:hypothetical protein